MVKYPKLLLCIEGSYYGGITEGKVYLTKEEVKNGLDFYLIKNNKGENRYYFKNRFKELEDKKKIVNILFGKGE